MRTFLWINLTGNVHVDDMNTYSKSLLCMLDKINPILHQKNTTTTELIEQWRQVSGGRKH